MQPIQTIDDMSSLFCALNECDCWSLHLLRIRSSEKNGVTYFARQITLKPDGRLKKVVESISDQYVEGKTSLSNRYDNIVEFDGVNTDKSISRLRTDSDLISDAYKAFVCAFSNPEVERDMDIAKYQGYVINGMLFDNEPVRLISLQNPITSYEHKNRFFCEGSAFQEITGDVLQLKNSVDAVVYRGYFYMMNSNAERLFDMERSYKIKCTIETQHILDQGIVSDSEAFAAAAIAGHNPRKFVSFNQRNLELLAASKTKRKKIGKKFGIPLTDEGTFDTTDKKNSDNLIKILCNKAMLEPFGKEPMEVESARSWK